MIMEINKKTKTILIISFTLLFIVVCIGAYFLITRTKKMYPKEPINQNSLQYTNQTIDLNKITLDSQDYKFYEISNVVMLEEVKAFVSQVGFNLKSTNIKEGVYYEWSAKKDSVIYRINQNSVFFSSEKGISWEEADISAVTFKTFIKKYFRKDWEFTLSQKEILPNGKTIYYAKRTLDGRTIETNEYKQDTDYLIFSNGKIAGGKILLTEFIDTGEILPSLNTKDLSKYINLKNYPKEIYPNYSTIGDSILKNVSYLSDDFEKITKTLNNCSGNSVEVIYFYKNLNQKYLIPTYKVDLQCQITYKETKYDIPAVGYVNAIDPKYIAVPE